MKRGYLKDHFPVYGYKKLAEVEVNPAKSNEHEFNGVAAFKRMFGPERRTIRAHIVYLTDIEEDIIGDDICVTWYNSRENHSTRNEYRLYYQSTGCIDSAEAGDLMVIALNASNQLNIFIAREGDTIEKQLAWLFDIDLYRDVFNRFRIGEFSESDADSFFTDLILERIGIEITTEEPTLLETLIKRFGNRFPPTAVFSQFAREMCEPVDAVSSPDLAVSRWLFTEEKAFKVFESHLVGKRLEKRFNDVDEFIRFSLSIHNRRKARAGFALENHLCHLFSLMGIRYSYNKATENRVKPDFVFPGIEHYHDPGFEVELLTMLGVKTTCKDRWRQVLSEAARIPVKHLLTMEPAISTGQTDEMKENLLRLVIPEEIRSSYTQSQQEWLINIREFTDSVKHKQRNL